MAISNPVSLRDVVFIQRSKDNNAYGEVHISGALLLFYTDENGVLTADKSGSFYAKFPPPSDGGVPSPGDGTTLYTGSTYEITSSWAISASWAPGSSPGTTLYTGSTYEITSSWSEWATISLHSVSSSFSSHSLSSTSASWSSKSLTTISSSFASSSLSSSFLTFGRYTIADLTASLFGTSSAAISASYAPGSPSISASYAVSASWAPSNIQFGIVSGSNFSGSNQNFVINLPIPTPNTIYSIQVTGEDVRIWSIGNRTTSSFTIYSNSHVELEGYVFWQIIF